VTAPFPLFHGDILPIFAGRPSLVSNEPIERRNQLDRFGHMTAGPKPESRVTAKVDLQVCPFRGNRGGSFSAPITPAKRRSSELRCIVTATVKEAVANAEIPKEKEIAKARARSTRP
jgi:hypothetical protein